MSLSNSLGNTLFAAQDSKKSRLIVSEFEKLILAMEPRNGKSCGKSQQFWPPLFDNAYRVPLDHHILV